MPRIAFIGAGSVEFTRNVLADLLSAPDLGKLSIALHDISEERLRTAGEMARATAAAVGASAGVEVHLERRSALAGADYVVNEIQVGGYDATRRDFDIPKHYGLRQTIADTIGIGGIFRGLRTIPVMLEIGNDMAELCPDAWLLNYTNPMAMLPWAVYEGTPFRNVVGLCHSVRDTHSTLAELVGVPEEEITYVTAGFNHQAFVLTFSRSGEDLYPRLREVVESDPELQRRVRVEIFRRFGYFPTESSEHSAEYVPWFMHHDSEIERFRIPVDEYLRRSDENLNEYEEIKRELASGGPISVEPTSELASEVIHSMETGTPRVVYGNVRNDGLINGLPSECCVEVPCEVDAQGIGPQAVGTLPAQLLALNRTFLNVVELTVRAALEGSRGHVYQAAMLDPNTAATLTLREIRQLCDELIEAHGDLMPEGIRRG
ncbi:MAG: alpha-glucosidase/alpha-galactosidase [Actinomycetota bacterium]|nr:alpha-glucosidase/alpha-galactosidase [Actinomycetota bacterium]